MSKKQCGFDERLYPVAWRFNAEDCLLSDSEKNQLFCSTVRHRKSYGMHLSPAKTSCSLTARYFDRLTALN